MGSGCSFWEQFDPADSSTSGETCLSAEQSIANTIMGSGACVEDLSDGVLRFIRYLLSISRPARFGFLPNFRDLDAVRGVARQFIRYCGSSSVALTTMQQALEGESIY